MGNLRTKSNPDKSAGAFVRATVSFQDQASPLPGVLVLVDCAFLFTLPRFLASPRNVQNIRPISGLMLPHVTFSTNLSHNNF